MRVYSITSRKMTASIDTNDIQKPNTKNDVTNYNEKEKSSLQKIEYDQLVSSAGEIGVYQLLLFFATCPVYMFGGFSYFSQMFMTEVSPNHWCWVPELENLTQIERRHLAIPQGDNYRYGYSQCKLFKADWAAVLDSGQGSNNTWPTGPCNYGWEFNKSEIPYPTIASEMDWVCERNSYQATAQAVFFLGSVVGGFLIGWIADRYGRVPAGIFSNMIGCIAGVASIFAKNFVEFSVCRFIMGISFDNSMMMIFLLILEYVSPKYRTVLANLSTGIFYTIGLVILPWLALACGHWKTFGLVTSIPMAFSALTFYMIPESPRWLLSKGRVDEAITKLLNVGKINNKVIPSELVQQFKSNTQKIEDENSSVLEIFKRPLLRWVLLCACLNFMCCSIIFDALVRSIDSLSFDFFLSFTMVSLTELPSVLIVSFALDLTGRKWLSVVAMLICCVFSILISFVGTGISSVLCAVVARFGVNISYMICLQWAAELMPTPVRGAGASLVHICGFVATIVSPYIVYTENYVPGLPLIIIGVIAAIGACAVIYLPETARKPMPQTFDEAESVVINKKFFDIPFLRK